MDGYAGRLLHVDLTTERTWDEPLDEEWARAYWGGSGLGARYLWDRLGRDTDPLGPDNPLLFLTGPLPAASRSSVCGRSPLTGLWGEANAGGFFGPELRFAGYDGIVVGGAATRPLWLSIVDGVAALHDAWSLWGLDTYQTRSQVCSLMGEARARVACVGPAGEKRALMAAVMNDHGRAAARTGLGAVMGAKGLKAIGVRGHGAIPVARSTRLREVGREIGRALAEDMSAMALRLAGTAGYVDTAAMYGDLPARYFTLGEWEGAANLSGVLMAQTLQNRAVACFRCPVACGRQTRAPRFGLAKVDGPEYETIGALGSLLLFDDLETIINANHLCNRYGLDTISFGVTVGLAYELAARGLLSPEDTGGIDLRFGDSSLLPRLIELTAHRQGFGNLLAEGSDRLAARFGAPELAVTVRGLEVPMHDPRAFAGMAATYTLSPRGACHLPGDMYAVDTGQGAQEKLGVQPGDRFAATAEKGRVVARQAAWRSLYNALGLCQFVNPGVDLVLEALNAATGWAIGSAGALAVGKDILTLKRRLNVRLGLCPADDRLPPLLMKPLSQGGTEGYVPDVPALLAGAYAELGWDSAGNAP